MLGVQGLVLGGGFHAFGHHLQAQAARHAHNGVHDGGAVAVAVAVGGHVAHKAAIDLEHLQWQLAQHR